MITKIEICNTAAFGRMTTLINDLKKLNFFFGANGTGKTTISKVIADPSLFPECNLAWEKGITMERRVYNRDFVVRNFDQKIPGVFTLGEQEVDTCEKIAKAKADIDKLNGEIEALMNTLQGEYGNGGKKNELSQLETTYAERFWSAKQRHEKKLAGGLRGYMGSKKDFKDKVLDESLSNKAELRPLEKLETKAVTVFSDTLVQVQNIPTIQPRRLLSFENASILRKRVIGKEDVDIAAIIKKLGNSDWVRQGLSYYQANDGVCPFCQQQTDESFAQSLNEYFDETFEQDSAAINALITDYTTESERIQQQVQAIINLHSEFVDSERIEDAMKLLDLKVAVNLQLLDQKRKEASQVIELDSLQNVLNEIVELIAAANAKIDESNAIVSDITGEKRKLTGQIWRFIIEELKNDITAYNTQKTSLSAAIESLQEQLQIKNKNKSTLESTLRELEKQNVSIQPTIDGINKLLALFGFTSFKLARGSDDRTYKLVRANGSDAQDTLSEGEKNFVTFLYFYYLLKGSHDESGMNADKVVVFDDPVSSLDSDVLFVVSTLIRELYEDICQNKGTIKQLFVLTHNVYFHKEVTYNSKRPKDKLLKDESFWLIKKRGDYSFVEQQEQNPIKTSYELLWEEVRAKPEQRNNATIQNTLRRILENYFKLLGGIPLNELYTYFEGDDRIRCKDLCSWVNDGSHSGGILSDEYYSMPDDTTVERYLQVFKEIFEQCNHTTHFNMMMGIDHDTGQEEETDNEQA
jgi:wobble nucleotide-excising tRNase